MSFKALCLVFVSIKLHFIGMFLVQLEIPDVRVNTERGGYPLSDEANMMKNKQKRKKQGFCSDPSNAFFKRGKFSMNDRVTSPNRLRNKIYRTRKPKKHKKTVTHSEFSVIP